MFPLKNEGKISYGGGIVDYVVETKELTKVYGEQRALDRVNVYVPKGTVFGLLGPNGAGKTTTIKILLDIVRPTSSEAYVFGMNAQEKSVEIKRRVGYLTEKRLLFDYMRVHEIVSSFKEFYPSWDHELENEIRRKFDVPWNKPIRALSLGERTKVAILLALARNPELLILDEPTNGLDPIMRNVFLNDILRSFMERGNKTILLASHVLLEVEKISDYVAIINKGKILLQAPMVEVKERMKKVVCKRIGRDRFLENPSVIEVEEEERGLKGYVRGDVEEVLRFVKSVGGEVVAVEDLDLNEIFVLTVKHSEK
jgi:ABC-2 type transport system ATP-binding protein